MRRGVSMTVPRRRAMSWLTGAVPSATTAPGAGRRASAVVVLLALALLAAGCSSGREPAPAPPQIVAREVTIAMQIATLRGAMGRAGQVVLQRVLAGCQSRTEVAVTVLAMLELVRRRQATIQQDELFGPIVLRPIGTGSA